MWWVDIVGYAAALAVLGSFCMSTIVPLRILAVVSNVLFGVYGVLAHLYPVFVLHTVLLPINLFKLARTRLSAEARRVSGPILPQADRTE
jgi:CRP/FNR family cyclic AMP-dependent transcriptional regulator